MVLGNIYIFVDDLSSELTSGATNNLANAGSGMAASSYSTVANMNIIDNRPPPPPHSNLLHMAGNYSKNLNNDNQYTNNNH